MAWSGNSLARISMNLVMSSNSLAKVMCRFLGYVSVSGEVYKVDRPVSEAPLPNDPDMELVLDESDSSIGRLW